MTATKLGYMNALRSYVPTIRGIDILLALAECGVVIALAAVAFEPESASAMPMAIVLGATLGTTVLFAWRFPVVALITAIVALLAYHLAEITPVGMSWPLVIPYVVVAARGSVRIGAITAVILSVNSIGWRIWVEHEPSTRTWTEEALSLAVVALALAVGAAMHQRQLWAEEVRERLRQVQVSARRENERLVAESRLAAAADLHDIAGHSLVSIGLQLQIAAETLDDDPAAGRDAIASALRAHDRAIVELSETVRLLREGSRSPLTVEGTSTLDLTSLRELARSAGLDLTVQVDLRVPMEPDVAVAAYRILQEALTNTIRHSGAEHATLSISADADGLRLAFADDGQSSHLSPGAGHGLRGMRERARQLGGTLDAGPLPSRGFQVVAWLPAPGVNP